MTREDQGYPCWQRDMMMMMMTCNHSIDPEGIILYDHHSHYCNYPKWPCKKRILILLLMPTSWRLFNSFSTNSLQFLAQWLFKKFFTMSTNNVQEGNSKQFIKLTNLVSFLMLRWNHFHDVHHIMYNGICVFNWDVIS